MAFLIEALVFLVAALIAVSLGKRLGLSCVLGYLAAGLIIGPHGLDVVGDVESVLHFAEIGVVMLLFIIGLELQPRRLWVMRRLVFGLGTAQMVIWSNSQPGQCVAESLVQQQSTPPGDYVVGRLEGRSQNRPVTWLGVNQGQHKGSKR